MVIAASSPVSVPASRVGFIGLGMMGGRIAARLLREGVPLVVQNRDPAKTVELVAAGALAVPRPVDVGRAVGDGVTFLMVTDGVAVAQVLFGRNGLARGLRRGATVIDLSTIDPQESRRFAARLARIGVTYLDAPVGGSIGPAERGELTVFIGGPSEAIERVRPWLSRIARRIESMGPTGAGASMKLVNNHLTITSVAMISEAVALAEAFGLPRDRVVALLRGGGGASAMLEGKQANLVQRQYPPAFRLALARKDLRLVERAGRRLGQATALAREARRLSDEALGLGHATEDFSSVFEAARARLGGSRAGPRPGAGTPIGPPPGT